MRCPKCKNWVFVWNYDVDFVHVNCSSQWKVFDHNRKLCFKNELLEQRNSNLTGMQNDFPFNRKVKDSTIDKDKIVDFYFEIEK